jgi:hypothetical protein
MSMWSAIVIITIACIAGEVFRHHTRSKNQGGGKAVDEVNERLDHLEAELRDRIETLERIVTDRKEDLKRQFDYLDKAS